MSCTAELLIIQQIFRTILGALMNPSYLELGGAKCTKFGEFGLRGRIMHQPTKFAAQLHGWYINDTTNFPTLYSAGPNWTPSS